MIALPGTVLASETLASTNERQAGVPFGRNRITSIDVGVETSCPYQDAGWLPFDVGPGEPAVVSKSTRALAIGVRATLLARLQCMRPEEIQRDLAEPVR